MPIEIGHVEAIFRYPVKSMGGERLEVADLGWHGLDGDRRLAFRRIDDRSGFPWISATKLPELLLFAPHRREDGAQGDLPTHIRTPDGEEMPVFGEDLATEVGRRFRAPVQMMQLDHGIFDEASISVIASDTVREIGRLAGRTADVRRFRPNIVVRLLRSVPFQENEWVGGVLSFGEGDHAPAITVTMRDARCSMVNLDPDSTSRAPEMLKAVVRANQNNAGVYGAVTRIGRLAVGQTVLLRAATLLGLVLFASLPSRSWGQGPLTPGADSSLRNFVSRISADNHRSVRLTSRETGRVEGYRVSLLGDSVLLNTDSGVRAIALANIDSAWVQQGTAAPILGLIAGVPCAVFGGLVGAFIGGDPDSNGSNRRATIGILIGMLGGGFVCGSVGAGIGSLIRRWRLEYARPAEAAT